MSAHFMTILINVLIAIEHPNTPAEAQRAWERERAVGVMQIRPICIKQVNETYELRVYATFGRPLVVEDCQSEAISRWVAVQYLTYCRDTFIEKNGRNPSMFELARCWNGGPNGYRRQSTIEYQRRFMNALQTYQKAK